VNEIPRTIRAQLGPFAMVPVWVLDACADSRAIHLYALLGKYTNRERRAWPKTERLALEMATSQRTVERAIATLRRAGALQTERRRRADGAVLGLDFLLVQAMPVKGSLPATGGGLDVADLPAIGGGLLVGQPATGDGAKPPRAAVNSVLELDPVEPDQGQAGAPRRRGADVAEENVAIITLLAHEVLDLYAETPDVTIGEVVDSVKARCVVLGIVYNSGVLTSAIESACYQRARAGKSTVLRGSSGAAAYRLGRG